VSSLERVRTVIRRPALPRHEMRLEREVDALAKRLESAEAIASIQEEPYWPKWDSPWWWMTLLWEMGEAKRIPRAAAEAMARTLATHYLPIFPLREEEIPPGTDVYRHVMCHCALGTMYRVLRTCGIDVDAALPGARPWFLRYQMTDGGLNCDEAAYTRPVPRSSMVSTLPPMEAILLGSPGVLTPDEERFLDRGAGYILARSLFRSVSRGGAPIREEWLTPCFPRFYFYDVLRGLQFIVCWGLLRRQPIPAASIVESVEAIDRAARTGGLRPRREFDGAKTRGHGPEGRWTARVEATAFPLLELAGDSSRPSAVLHLSWEGACAALCVLDGQGHLVDEGG